MTDSPDAVADSPDDVPADDETAHRSPASDELWSELRVDPVKVALPGGDVGYTLRAYRPASELTPTETPAAEVDEDDPFAARERARAQEEAELAEAAEAAALAGVVADPDAEPGDESAPEAEELEADQEEAAELEEEEADEEAAAEPEELPVFLSHRGRLLLFRTPESMVSFITSDAPHDLAQIDTWPSVVKRVRAADVVPTDDDTYELDLVVENLRGGHDAWDVPLLVSAGEFARDVGFALRLTPVITALSSGSPLDDLDEALRATAGGGFGGFFARRRLRRVGAQQASLGWRTVIGKIAAAVDWHD